MPMKKKTVRRGLLHFPLLAFMLLLLLFRWGIPYILLAVEADSLYLDTSDYWHQMEQEHAWPICAVVKEYVCQLFVNPWIGASLLAFCLSAPLYAVNVVCRRYRGALYWSMVIQICVVCVATVYVLLPSTRTRENWCRLEHSAICHDWEDVLRVATPEAVKTDHDQLPYALLALAVRGELTDHMLDYPLESSRDFDMGKPFDRRFYTFRMVLYDCLGCPNEALHNAFQLASFMRCGMSLGVLRQMVRYSREMGDNALSAKYGRVLSSSTFHFSQNSSFIVLSPPTDTLASRWNAFQPLLTERLGYNVGELLDTESPSPLMYHYFLCMLLADCQLSSFVTVLQRVRPSLPTSLPRLYQEALLVSADRGLLPPDVSGTVEEQVVSDYEAWKAGRATSTLLTGHYWQYLSRSSFR